MLRVTSRPRPFALRFTRGVGGQSIPQHTLIIGAGVIGLCSARFLVERGHRVTIVDRGTPGDAGCSFGNAGMIVPSHFVPLAAPGMVRAALRMMLRSRSPFFIKPRLSPALIDWMWKFHKSASAAHVEMAGPLLRDLHLASRALYAGMGDIGLEQRGLLMLCRTPHGLDEESAAAVTANRLGVPAETLSAAQLREREPAIDLDVAGGVLYPKDCHLSPDKLMTSLRQALAAAGARFLWSTPITGWARGGTKLIAARTPTGDLPADAFVLSGGVWSSDLARELRLKLPMQAGKGYSLTLAKPRQTLRSCAILTEARVAVTPMGGALRFGGTMEMSGVNERIGRKRVEGITRSASKYLPAFSEGDFAGVKPWCGLRPCSPDGLPYLGRTRRAENLVVATGHAMMGVSLAPITGKLVTQLIEGEQPEIGIKALCPDRFA